MCIVKRAQPIEVIAQFNAKTAPTCCNLPVGNLFIQIGDFSVLICNRGKNKKHLKKSHHTLL